MYSKFPLLLLHGALAEKSQFSPLKPYLTDLFEVFELDFDGHGVQPVSETGFNMDAFRDTIIRYTDTLSFERIHVFGYSMGGYAALAAALEIPERIASVFTLGTKLFWTEEGSAREVKMLDADTMEAKVPAFVESLKNRHKAIDWRELLQLTTDMMLDLGRNDRLPTKALSQINCPVRLTCGDKDNTAPLEDTLKAFRLIPGAQLQVFPATPHPFEKINHARLAEAMIGFFTEVHKKTMPSKSLANFVY